MMKILLPVDGSEPALDAIRHAIRLTGDGLRASFVLANVQEPSSLYEMVVVHDPQALQQVALEAGQHAVSTAARLLDVAALDYEIEIASGEPAHTLVDVAENYQCDAIIMSAHGEGDNSAALGSVAQTVLKSAHLPVMIVRPEEPGGPQASESDIDDQGADSAP